MIKWPPRSSKRPELHKNLHQSHLTPNRSSSALVFAQTEQRQTSVKNAKKTPADALIFQYSCQDYSHYYDYLIFFNCM